MIDGSGMIDGLPPDLSERADEYLLETFSAKTTSRAPQRGKGSLASLGIIIGLSALGIAAAVIAIAFVRGER